MKRILCSLLVATLPLGSVLAGASKSKNAKVTLVYQHELPNVPGKSIKGVLVAPLGPGRSANSLVSTQLRRFWLIVVGRLRVRRAATFKLTRYRGERGEMTATPQRRRRGRRACGRSARTAACAGGSIWG